MHCWRLSTREKNVVKIFMEKLIVPNGVTVQVNEDALVVSSGEKSFEIPFNNRVVKIKSENGEVAFATVGKATKPRLSMMRTIIAHLKNAFIGIATGFSKKLQVVYSHFPVSIEIKGNQASIKNFLGEKVPRLANIIGGTKVEVKGQDLLLTGSDKYSVGQTANNLMQAVRVREKDRRVFQDGIYPVIE